MEKKELMGISVGPMKELLGALGEPAYRGTQLFRALYRERQWELDRVTTLSARLRRRLSEQFQVTLPRVERKFQSSDGTMRYLLSLSDGREVEAVLMPEEGRNTICLSSQVGCAVDCKFCLTGVMGFQRNLT